MGWAGPLLSCDRIVASVYTLSKSRQVVTFSILTRLVILDKTSEAWVAVCVASTSDNKDESVAVAGFSGPGGRAVSDSGLGTSSNFSSILGVGDTCGVGEAEPRRNAVS